jgi:putative restriction endonuclease
MVNHVERAYRAWPILVDTAVDGARTLTYGELADKLWIHHRAIRYILGVIQNYCLEHELPPLTILVVNAKTGTVGEGFIAWDHEDLERGRTEVADFAWGAIENPFVYASNGSTEEDLVRKLVAAPGQAAEVFALVKVRGTAQIIFRKAPLEVYKSACAFCGLTFENALEAAHFIPWGAASPQERLDPSNGILLCSSHHRLLDAGFMTLSASGNILYRDPECTEGTYSSSDKAMTVSLNGMPASLPISKRHRPSKKAVSRHHAIYEWENC